MTPSYQTAGAGCFDLSVVLDAPLVLYPKNIVIVDTGLGFDVPAGWVMEVNVRSSMGFKYGISLCNDTGQIDSDYRGSVKLALINLGPMEVTLQPSERVAQAKLVVAPRVVLTEVKELPETERGVGGFGSTGKV